MELGYQMREARHSPVYLLCDSAAQHPSLQKRQRHTIRPARLHLGGHALQKGFLRLALLPAPALAVDRGLFAGRLGAIRLNEADEDHRQYQPDTGRSLQPRQPAA